MNAMPARLRRRMATWCALVVSFSLIEVESSVAACASVRPAASDEAAASEELLVRAWTEYRAGSFRTARALFEDALATSRVDPGPVLHDIGSCAYRLGEYAEAVLFYRRAALRMPRSRAVAFDLHLAEEQLGLDAPVAESFASAVRTMIESLSIRELLLIVVLAQTAGLLGLVLLRGRPVARSGAGVLVVLTFALAARLVERQWTDGPREGIVLERSARLRAEPHEEMPVLYELPLGETVRVEEMSDRWVRVSSEGAAGWTEREAIGVVE